jgi:enoyl-CoA hydratase
MDDAVLLEVIDRVALITLNRPNSRNALNSAMIEGLSSAMNNAERNSEVDVVVLTGAGRAFCAGLDLKEMASSGGIPEPNRDRPWQRLTKPMLGAVNGATVTGGLELALACDFLIASDNAIFADTHTRVGLVPFWGLSVLLPQAVGLRTAREMSLTGNFIDAAEALRCGLVNRVVSPDALISVGLSLAADIASADRSATRAMLARYADFSGGGAEALLKETRDAEAFLRSSFDIRKTEERRVALMSRAPTQRP